MALQREREIFGKQWRKYRFFKNARKLRVLAFLRYRGELGRSVDKMLDGARSGTRTRTPIGQGF